MTVADSDIIQKVRNTACIVCGQRFSLPRAGKLYCSAKCKQFSFYHKEHIMTIRSAIKGIHEALTKFPIKEYEYYERLTNNRLAYRNLISKVGTRFFSEKDKIKLARLEKNLSTYYKTEKPRFLSLEEWSFFKVLYPNVNKNQFVKIIDSLSKTTIDRIRGDEQATKNKSDTLRNRFEHHLEKILKGEVQFR